MTSKTYASRSNASRAARKALGKTAKAGTDFEVAEIDGGFTWTAATTEDMVMLSTENGDLGLAPASEANKRAAEEHEALGVAITIRCPVTDKVIATVGGKPARKAEGPTGMVAKILELASRAEGVTPAELNETTNWRGAPWKWLFKNPKGTGYCDRHGFTFQVQKEGRRTTYRVEKQAA